MSNQPKAIGGDDEPPPGCGQIIFALMFFLLMGGFMAFGLHSCVQMQGEFIHELAGAIRNG